MIVIRHAFSDAAQSEARERLLDEHKVYLRNAPIKLLLSGPLYEMRKVETAGGLVVAQVETLAEFEAFSADDPFVLSGVYSHVLIMEWRPSTGYLKSSI